MEMATVYKRGDIWWVRFRFGGAHVRRSAKTTKKAEAQAYLLRLMEEHAQAHRGETRDRYLFTDAIVRYFEECTLKPGTVVTYRFNAKVCARLIGHLHLDEINKRVLSDFVAARKRTGVSDATVRRDLAFIGSLFTMAIRWDWIDASPIATFNKKALKECRPRTRFLSKSEYSRLEREANKGLKPIIRLAVETGLRKEELLGLTTESIDLQRREIHLHRTKTNTPRRVPLSPLALATIKELLEQQSRPRSAYLFCKADGSRVGSPRKAFETACSRAEIADFRFHDLRHTFASWWVQDGGDLYRLSRILGHTTLQMTARYGHLRTDDLHSELERVARNRTRGHQIEETVQLRHQTVEHS
jgi:integrase/recombinase XerD